MSFLSSLFSDTATATVSSLADAAKKFITTDQDRMAFEKEMVQIVNDQTDKLMSHADNYESELSKRQAADMASDSWLSKNIRPMAVIFFLTIISLMGFGYINATPAYLDMIKEFTSDALMFYFGGRSLEKVASMVTSRWDISKK